MPKYAPPQRPSRRDSMMQQTELDQRQQELDSKQSSGFLNQIMQLYGLQQERELAPVKLAGMQAQNTAAELANSRATQASAWDPYNMSLQGQEREAGLAKERFAQNWAQPNAEQQYQHGQLANEAQAHENAWAGPMSEARYNATNALGAQRNDKVGTTPQEAAILVQYGIWTPDQAREALMSPEQKAATEAQKQVSEQQRQAMILADQQQQGQPTQPQNAYESGLNSHPFENIGRHALNLPASLYNMHYPPIDYVRGLLGAPEEMVPAGDQYYDFMTKGQKGYSKGTRRRGEKGSTEKYVSPNK